MNTKAVKREIASSIQFLPSVSLTQARCHCIRDAQSASVLIHLHIDVLHWSSNQPPRPKFLQFYNSASPLNQHPHNDRSTHIRRSSEQDRRGSPDSGGRILPTLWPRRQVGACQAHGSAESLRDRSSRLTLAQQELQEIVQSLARRGMSHSHAYSTIDAFL